MRGIFAALLCTSTCMLTTNVEGSITIASSFLVAGASDMGNSSSDAQSSAATSFPPNATLDVVAGNSHSKNVINWSTSGGQTVLSFDIDHQRDGSFPSFSQTYEQFLVFTANSSDPYDLSGRYHVTDVGAGESGFVHFQAWLKDLTAATYLFDGRQESIATNNEQFTLGEVGGDQFSYVIGSPTGNLITGHEYELYFNTLIQATPDTDSGASALGNITLRIGSAGVIPEPMSMFVWAGLMYAVGMIAKR